MNKIELENNIAACLCKKEKDLSCADCFTNNNGCKFSQNKSCRIKEKTQQQLEYITSSIVENIYLEACPGSGKTEVVGMKASYEIARWNKRGGLLIISFTNDSTNVIKNRIDEFTNSVKTFPHFVGTVSSFIHKYIVQPFGYKKFGYSSDDNDNSFRIVSEKSDYEKNFWLKKYKSKIYMVCNSYNRSIGINQFDYDAKTDSFNICTGYNNKESFEKFFYSNSFFCYEYSKIQKTDKNYNYWNNYIKEQKKIFFKDGFATFGDMNYIAYLLLNNDTQICKIISLRFPLIIVDECQDLSYIEIKILELLQKRGSVLHLVGDLNQSIYQFKGVDINDVKNFTSKFRKMILDNNFRSCQSLVNFSSKLISSEGISIRGLCENKFIDKSNSLLFFEYDNPIDLLGKYLSLIDILNIDKDKVSVLVKQNCMKNNLLNIDVKNDFLLLSSIVYWKFGNVNQKIEALNNIGKQISKWMNDIGQSDRYYCPKCINSIFVWRIFIMNLLKNCIIDDTIMNFDVNLKKWHKIVREELPKIIKEKLKILEPSCIGGINLEEIFSTKLKFNTPQNKGDILVSTEVTKMVDNSLDYGIRIETIHQSKGCTYDSNLVISSPNRSSESGYWKQWLEDDGESRRIGYVASTRAKYLLVWGVPMLEQQERNKLFELGFKDGNEIVN